MYITYPDAIVSSIDINWAEIKKHIKDTNMIQNMCMCGAHMDHHYVLGHLIRQLGYIGHSEYELNGTSGKIEGAQAILSKYAFEYQVTRGPVSGSMLSDVQDGILVMFGEAAEGDSHGNHCFIIDGCDFLTTVQQIYKDTGRVHLDGTPYRIYVGEGEKYSHSLYHINWGDGGKNNGYFSAGVYDTRRVSRIDDEKDSSVIHNLDPSKIEYLKVKIN